MAKSMASMLKKYIAEQSTLYKGFQYCLSLTIGIS